MQILRKIRRFVIGEVLEDSFLSTCWNNPPSFRLDLTNFNLNRSDRKTRYFKVMIVPLKTWNSSFELQSLKDGLLEWFGNRLKKSINFFKYLKFLWILKSFGVLHKSKGTCETTRSAFENWRLLVIDYPISQFAISCHKKFYKRGVDSSDAHLAAKDQ